MSKLVIRGEKIYLKCHTVNHPLPIDTLTWQKIEYRATFLKSSSRILHSIN